jgi:hypothetical protein
MKNRKGGEGSFDPARFVTGLTHLVESLPSADEQQKNAAALDAIIRFLMDMKERVAAIPTRDDTKATRLALGELSALFAKATANPLLAAAIGIRSPVSRQLNPPPSGEEIENAKRAIAQFNDLPIDQLRLAVEKMSLSELKALASELGIRSSERTSHEGLSHKIATRITNTRGYRTLRIGNRPGEP